MDPDEIVAAVEDLDIDDLADLVEDLPDTVIDEVLKSMDRENRERLEQVLSYPEDTAGRLMNPDVVTVRADAPQDLTSATGFTGSRTERRTRRTYSVENRHKTGITLQVRADQTILSALKGANIDVQSDCCEGLCGSCETRVLSGAVDHHDVVLTRGERDAQDRMMVCCSRAAGDKLVLEL